MLESCSLVKKYLQKTALDQVSLHLYPGHIYALLGPNGSGKTTWMKAAAGLIKPTSGVVLYEGQPVNVESRRHIAYMSTEPYFYNWMSVSDVGRYYQDFFDDYDPQRFRYLLQVMGLHPAMRLKVLSSGMMAKLRIAVTMSRHARVFMLDEPFNGIDLLARDTIEKAVLSSVSPDTTILISSHMVEELETIVDMAVFLKDGRLVEVRELEQLRRSSHQSIVDRYREIYGYAGEAASWAN